MKFFLIKKMYFDKKNQKKNNYYGIPQFNVVIIEYLC